MPKKSFRKYKKKSAKGYGYLDKAQKALSVALSVKKLLNVEYKFLDNNFSGLPTYDIPFFQLLNGVATGDNAISRDGSSIKLINLQMKLRIVNSGTNVTQTRIMLVLDRQPNKAQFTLSDLTNVTSSTGDVLALRNLDYNKRFHIFYDKVHLTDGIKQNQQYVEYFKPLEIKPRYEGTGSTIANITTNAIYFVAISNEAVAANPPSITVSTRMRFIDN